MVKGGTKRKGRRKKDKKPEKRPKTKLSERVLAGSDSDSSSDSGHLFKDALQAKNAASSSKRALHKHIKTQRNKWIKMYGSAPSTQTFVDANLARYVASTFEIHPNPPQVKQMRLFMKHQALQLGLANPMFTQQQARYPLLHEQMGGIRARPEFKSHTPVKAEVFDGYEYSFGLQWLFDQYYAAEFKPEAALNLAIWVLLTDVVNRPGTVKQVPVPSDFALNIPVLEKVHGTSSVWHRSPRQPRTRTQLRSGARRWTRYGFARCVHFTHKYFRSLCVKLLPCCVDFLRGLFMSRRDVQGCLLQVY
jgi:hypothetical protein